MSTNTSKDENDLCRCCHSEGSFKRLYTPYFWLDAKEIMFCNVLRDCFNIELAEMKDLSQQVLCGICHTCIQRLEDAVRFKQQVQKCEKRFQDVYCGFLGKSQPYGVTVKAEKMDTDEENEIFESTAIDNGAASDDTDRLAGDENNGDDDENNKDELLVQVTKSKVTAKRKSKTPAKRKSKTLAKTKSKTPATTKSKTPAMTKSKTAAMSNASASIAALDDDDEKIEVKHGLSFIRVNSKKIRSGVDFKATGTVFQCLRCPVTVRSKYGIKNHVKSDHFKTANFKCPTCFELVWKLEDLIKHKLEKHNIDNRFKCNACDKGFFRMSYLIDHTQIFHMLGDKLKCTKCKFETYSKACMKRHGLKHLNVKNYKCNYCQKTFKRRGTMQYHERIHTGDKRKVCTECGQAFVQRTSLKYHMIKHHPGVDF